MIYQPLLGPLIGLQKIALAVSGGSDSLALLHLVLDWQKQSGVKVCVLTVDHGLRAGSTAEAVEVSRICAALGVQHVILQWAGLKPVTGIQAKARTARYDLMTAWCKDNDVHWLLTGHTADDQAETVAMRMARTTSAKSLSGIWRTRDWNGVNLFRPLLDLKREALRDYLHDLGVTWIDDPSNDNPKFERVRIRRVLADGVAQNELLEIAARSQAQTFADQKVVQEWLREFLVIERMGYCRFARSGFANLTEVQSVLVLDILISHFGGGQEIERAKRIAMARFISSEQCSRRSLGGALIAARKSEIIIGREWSRIAKLPVVISNSGEMLWDKRFVIRGKPGTVVLAAGLTDGLKRDPAHPAFVQWALPAFLVAGKLQAVPYLLENANFAAEFHKIM